MPHHPTLLAIHGCSSTAGFAKSCKRKTGKLTLADYPSIARRWHPTKNEGRRPEDHKHASKERVWLQCGGCPVCAERHQWDARVDNLTQYGDNLVCPFCTSKGPSFCSCRSATDLLSVFALAPHSIV